MRLAMLVKFWLVNDHLSHYDRPSNPQILLDRGKKKWVNIQPSVAQPNEGVGYGESTRGEKVMTKQELHRSLGNYLKQKRVQAGVTQSEVAKKLGYSTPQFISNIERGLCSPPLKNLKVLMKMYRIPADELMGLIMREQEYILRKALYGMKQRTPKVRQ